MGSLQILNALLAKAVAKVPTGKGQASTGKGLLYVEAKLNGKPAQVMVDTGVTHNFITIEEANRLGLKVVGGGGWLKSINTNAKPLQGAARSEDVPCNVVHIMEKGVSCAVPTSVGTSSAKTLASMQLSAMQIVKGVKKGEATYLAALKMEDHVGDSTEPLPREIEEVLVGNKDVMPPELPKRLPPRREVDHQIELEPGAKPPSMAPYRMAPPELKEAVTEEQVLALPDHTKVFEVQTDASDFAIGGVLMQEGHPIAFESRKLNDTERRYTVQEKEMTAVVHCLRTWRHYLLGSRFLIKTDNIATSYFQSQKKLSLKQARWQDFLAEFDYVMEYKPGKANLVADALSRKAELAAMSKAKGDILEGIKEGMEHDPLARQLFKLAESGQTQRFWVEDGLLYTKGQRAYVPKWNNLRKRIIRECEYKGRSPLGAQVARSWNEQADVVRSYLDKAGCKMKKWADKRRRPKEYNLGDMVMLKLLPQQFKSFRKVHKGLIRRYEGPFPIVAKVGKVSYRLELPPKLKIHPVFHVSLLKPHYDDKEDPSCGESHRAPTAVVKSYDKEAEGPPPVWFSLLYVDHCLIQVHHLCDGPLPIKKYAV
ncbi:hypothetical protein RJ640_015365 [Escallonia rubra]|uniref:Reverse transcriptase RNase H-like domain-containing protein n=1 Tax=Escallonia rubra TaxID=112253 RepID=A0AA88U9D6_9ASTE|nr:hypothetical protein RJ640_015365 [Escallonia rubra]